MGKCLFFGAASNDDESDDDVVVVDDDDVVSFGLSDATAVVAADVLWLALECEFSCELESW